MSLKRIGGFAAGTILLLTGAMTLPTAAQEERCKNNEISAAGAATYLGKGRATRLAVTVWQREVLAKFGERFTDFAKAKGVRVDCESAGIGTVGRFKKRCIVRATPCRLASLADDDTVGEDDATRSAFRIQRWLSRLGYLQEDGVDGEFGPVTRDALRRFQREAGLRVTGEIDDATVARLRQRASQ
jgi:catechol 2,3-dioxygenase-like lactoylglutathione lyase family enzyme